MNCSFDVLPFEMVLELAGDGEQTPMPKDKIRIRMEAYDHQVLDGASASIVDAAKKSGARVHGPIPLPTRIERYTVLRSPHVNKKSREQFELSSYKRLLDIYSNSSATVDALMRLELPSGVEVEIKV